MRSFYVFVETAASKTEIPVLVENVRSAGEARRSVANRLVRTAQVTHVEEVL